MSLPRDVEQRIRWFLDNDPGEPGMCARHTWHSLGGDEGTPPRWGAANANAVIAKVRKSGRFWTPQTWKGPPPRGAVVLWKYGRNGHAALSNGKGQIVTTDPRTGDPTGIEDLDYPKRWGYDPASGPYSMWTDTYNGVRFDVGTNDTGEDEPPKPPKPPADSPFNEKVEDPVTGDIITIRQLLMRTRTNAKQAAEWSKPTEEPTEYDVPTTEPKPGA